MHTLGTEGGMGDKIEVVLNRIGADFMGGEISVKKAEETIGKNIFWQLPNDSKSMLGARNAGILLFEHAPRSKTQMSVQGLAQALSGQADHKTAPKEGGRRWFNFG
jgi:pilus assembly protein CpaE